MEKGNDQTRVEVDQMSLTTTRTRLGTTWEFDDDKPLDRRKRSIDQILSGNLLLFLLLLPPQSFLICYLFPISNDAQDLWHCIHRMYYAWLRNHRQSVQASYMTALSWSLLAVYVFPWSGVGHFAFCREYL